MTNSSKQETSSIQSIDRAVMLLKLIANRKNPISLAELVTISGLNRTTVWRILTTLENHNIIERDIVSKGYQIGYETVRMAGNTDQYAHLKRRALPSMERLRDFFQESVLLGIPKSFQILTIEQVNPEHTIRIADYFNVPSPLHCSSNGKLYLSSMSEKDIDMYLEKHLEKLTPNSITEPYTLKQELQETRLKGYGTNFGELDENENGISVSIYDENKNTIAFLSLAGPAFRFTKDKVLASVDRLLFEANEISKRIKN